MAVFSSTNSRNSSFDFGTLIWLQLDDLAVRVAHLLRWRHHLVPHRGHLGPVVLAEDGGHDVAAERGPRLLEKLGLRVDAELRAVRREAGQNAGGHAGQEGPANDGAAAQEYLGLLLQQDLRHEVSLHVLIEIPDAGVVDHPDFVHPVRQKLVRERAHAVSHQDGADGGGALLCQLPSGPDDLRDHGCDLAAPVLGKDGDARILS